MTIRRWLCKADGIQETSIRGLGETVCCPLCGARMVSAEDPRVQAPPRGEARPPRGQVKPS